MDPIEHAYQRFVITRFPLPTEEQVRALERQIHVELPDDYRRFILRFNGGYFNEPVITPVGQACPEDSLAYLSGIGAPHEEAELGNPSDMSLFSDNDPPKIMPIGATPLGSLIILDTAPGEERGTIYFKKAFGDFYYLADGIEGFFALLREPSEE